jgi:hypothetical protein
MKLLSLLPTSIFAALLVASVPEPAKACVQGFVWREASGPSDVICVTPAERQQARDQNQNYPYETCPRGLVWREATVGDHRCVTPEERTAAAQQNALARSRN